MQLALLDKYILKYNWQILLSEQKFLHSDTDFSFKFF